LAEVGKLLGKTNGFRQAENKFENQASWCVVSLLFGNKVYLSLLLIVKDQVKGVAALQSEADYVHRGFPRGGEFGYFCNITEHIQGYYSISVHRKKIYPEILLVFLPRSDMSNIIFILFKNRC
jgi:hypothetical protein